MAKKAGEEAAENAATGEVVTVSKEQLDELMKGYAELQRQLAFVNQRMDHGGDESKAIAAEKERELLGIVKKANEEAKEEVEIHVDLGGVKTNKNVDISINGVQYVVQKGVTVRVPKKVAEVIENAKKQSEISKGIQKEKTAEYAVAQASGGFDGISTGLV